MFCSFANSTDPVRDLRSLLQVITIRYHPHTVGVHIRVTCGHV